MQTDDIAAGRCTTRVYGVDRNSNRTTFTSTPDPATSAEATCATTGGTTVTRGYDTADRLTDPGYTYDQLGRTLTVAAADATGSDLIVRYHANDLVAMQTAGATTRSYSLDPTHTRIRAWTDTVSGTPGGENVNHYTGSGDSPAWTRNPDGSWTRNIAGIGGLAAIQHSNGTVTLQIANLHGDLVATMANDTTAVDTPALPRTDEYGRQEDATKPRPRYGWLGTHQRSNDTLGGTTLMGVRLYQPTLGRFLQVDPIPGGCANAYSYVSGDPINTVDLDGRMQRCFAAATQGDTVGYASISRKTNTDYTLYWGIYPHTVLPFTRIDSVSVQAIVNGKRTNIKAGSGHDRPMNHLFHANFRLQGRKYKNAGDAPWTSHTLRTGDRITFEIIVRFKRAGRISGFARGHLACIL